MIFGQTKLEFKVGVFVFVGLVILMSFIMQIRGFKTMASGHELNLTFGFVNGVKLGAPVRYAGVDVGEVKKINFLPVGADGAAKVQIVAWVRNEVKMPVDSPVWINTLGLLGEKYIEIMPGKDQSHYLAPGATLAGNDPVAMHQIGDMVKNIAVDIDVILKKIRNKEGALGKLIYDDKLYDDMDQSIVLLREQMQASISTLGTDLHDLIGYIKRNPWKLFWKSKERP
jgi:phospholipid/cholesterol/gamma-HCH transport system substrate-binding protein